MVYSLSSGKEMVSQPVFNLSILHGWKLYLQKLCGGSCMQGINLCDTWMLFKKENSNLLKNIIVEFGVNIIHWASQKSFQNQSIKNILIYFP